MSGKNQVTIPVSVLRQAGIAAGDDVVIARLQRGDDGAVDQFIVAIDATLVPLDSDIARCAARLRGSHRSLRLPDAISLASALIAGAEFVTLDHRLGRTADLERAST